MSSFYTQSIRLNSSLLGKRNSPATSFNLQEHLKNQFQRSCPSTALNSDESRKTSYDHREEDCSRSNSGATPNSLGPNLSQLSSSLNNHNRIQDSVFGRNSDMNENEFERFRSYAADLRFAPAGPRPPVPPVGGLFNYNDAAGTIKNNNSCLQSIYNKINNKQNIITSIPIVVEQQQSQTKISNSGFTENSIYLSNQTEISHNSSFTNSTSPNLMNNENFSVYEPKIDLINLENQSTGSSPQIELSTDHEELSSKFDEPQNIFAQLQVNQQFTLIPAFSENFDGSRRRDTKFEAKITASAKAPENNGKISCKGCHLLYHKLKFQGFCHNCYKIYEAVEQFVSLNNGKFEFVDKKCNFVLTCENSHQWKVDFKTKQVKKWCKTCKKSARATRKEYLKMMDEEEQKRKIEMQRELFNRARVPGQSHYAAGGNSSSSSSSPSSGSFFNNAYEECDLEDDDLHGGDLGGHHHGHGHYHVDSEEDKRQSEIFFSVLTGEEGEERKFSQEMMDQMVEYILNQTDSRLIRFLQDIHLSPNLHFSQQVSEDKRMRAFRRVARIVHPDKNHHPYAKDAFQKIFNCSIRSKPKNQKIWFWFGLLIEAEEVRCF